MYVPGVQEVVSNRLLELFIENVKLQVLKVLVFDNHFELLVVHQELLNYLPASLNMLFKYDFQFLNISITLMHLDKSSSEVTRVILDA